MDDEFGDDADLTAAFEAAEPKPPAQRQPNTTASSSAPKVQQPKPQALPNRAAPSSILVSSRQKGNPILNAVRSLPWEYSDIPADFVLGNTTCAFFLSLKYHRLHPEYIYTRIRALGGKYNLRVLLTMVDIQNHEDPLKELSKTSLVNNLTLILCWSAQEAGRYLELYKSYEHAPATSIRAHQSTSYSEKLQEFITIPRSINKTDALGLVSAFGSIKHAVNARPEEIGTIAGWGEKKVQRWCQSVREPFRVRKAARRGIGKTGTSIGLSRGQSSAGVQRDDGLFDGEANQPDTADVTTWPPSRGHFGSRDAENAPVADITPSKRIAAEVSQWEPGEDEEEALMLAAVEEEGRPSKKQQFAEDGPMTSAPSRQNLSRDSGMSEGMIAALAKLREQ
ncbi:MAG: ssDNA endonuclease and repair protein rad10 [Heterodermia speciosa]|uniref:SsDNA endonuclease and repair protein rad10 n=1 Tax=Heterodermia speciosa TaxID=116794 RepID=A0A8H3EVA2_9LECA|nr:MAG: ssDNA endonuclease and repair protein rad10 [Heterodermia speciosa]